MKLRNIITFLRVAELQNFTHAAEELGYSQSAVTVQIKQLETELGVPLFERIGRSVNLTSPGRAFLLHANEIMRAAERAKNSVQMAPEPEGILRIGTMESVGASVVSRLVSRYHKQFPLVKVVVSTATPEGLLDMMRRNDVDFVYFMDEKRYNPDWEMPLNKEEEIVFVAAPNHPLAKAHNLSIRDIIAQNCVLTEEGEGYRKPFDRMLAEHSLKVNPILEIGNTEVIMRMVREGVGISLLPNYVVADPLAKGEIVVLDVPDFRAKMFQQLIYHKNKWVTPQMKGFIDLIIEREERA